MTDQLTIDEFDLLGETADELDLDIHATLTPERVGVLTADGEISAVKWGEQPAEVVFLHGRAPTQSARSWDPVALGLDRAAIALDFPGVGHSQPRADRAYTPQLVAPALADAIDQLAPQRSLIVGGSFGGLTALALAGIRPDLVPALALVDVLPRFPTPPEGSDNAEHAHPEPPPESFDSADAIVDHLLATGSNRTRAALTRNVLANAAPGQDGRWAWRFDAGAVPLTPDALDLPGLWDVLVTSTVPLLVVRGAQSPVVSDDALDALRAARPDVRVVVIDGAGHEIHEDAPAALVSALSDFAAELG